MSLSIVRKTSVGFRCAKVSIVRSFAERKTTTIDREILRRSIIDTRDRKGQEWDNTYLLLLF